MCSFDAAFCIVLHSMLSCIFFFLIHSFSRTPYSPKYFPTSCKSIHSVFPWFALWSAVWERRCSFCFGWIVAWVYFLCSSYQATILIVSQTVPVCVFIFSPTPPSPHPSTSPSTSRPLHGHVQSDKTKIMVTCIKHVRQPRSTKTWLELAVLWLSQVWLFILIDSHLFAHVC